MKSLLLGVASICVAASSASAQGMTFNVADGHWMLLSNSFITETNDPIGLIMVDGSLVNTYSTSNGDHCAANGISRDAVAGGSRLQQAATSIGYHSASWEHVGEGMGDVEIAQQAVVDGSVTLVNTNCGAAALGFAQASSSLTTPSLAVLLGSAATTVAGALGDLSGAYAGIAPQTPVVHLGVGTYADSDFATNFGYACTNLLTVDHKSRSFIKVLSLRTAVSPGNAQATGSMTGDCATWAVLGHCPE